MKKLVILAGAALFFTACAQSPTSPSTGRRIAPTGANHDDDFCASGYIIAYDEQGNPYCVPEDASRMSGSGGDGSATTGSTGTSGNNGGNGVRAGGKP